MPKNAEIAPVRRSTRLSEKAAGHPVQNQPKPANKVAAPKKAAPKKAAPKKAAPKKAAPKKAAPKKAAPKKAAPKKAAPKKAAPKKVVAPKKAARKNTTAAKETTPPQVVQDNNQPAVVQQIQNPVVDQHAQNPAALQQNQNPVIDQSAHNAVLNVRQDTPVDLANLSEADKKKQNLLHLRTVLWTNLNKRFEKDKTWLPDAAIVRDANEFFISKTLAGAKQGCKVSMKEETASFELLTGSEDSMNALSQSVSAYVDAYSNWRDHCARQGNPQCNLAFDLVVYNKDQIKPILKMLEENQQTLRSIEIIDPNTGAKQKLEKPEEIAQYSSKNQNSQGLTA